MELFTYLCIAALAVAMSGSARAIPSPKIFMFIVAICMISLSVIVRTSEMDADIVNYTTHMSNISFNFLYLREPVVWIGQQFLFEQIQNPVYVFIIYDLIALIALAIAFQNDQLPQYAFLAILVFFPFIMGMQNVYRQWFSACFFLLALATVKKNPFVGTSAFVVAVASHNVAAVFVGVLFLHSNFRHKKLLVGLSVAATPFALWIGGATKSDAATGLPLHFVYVALLAGIAIALFVLQKTGKQINRGAFHAAALVVYIAALSTLALSSAGSERVSQFGLLLLYPALVLTIETNIQRTALFRAALVVLGFIPMFMFGVRDFIF